MPAGIPYGMRDHKPKYWEDALPQLHPFFHQNARPHVLVLSTYNISNTPHHTPDNLTHQSFVPPFIEFGQSFMALKKILYFNYEQIMNKFFLTFHWNFLKFFWTLKKIFLWKVVQFSKKAEWNNNNKKFKSLAMLAL